MPLWHCTVCDHEWEDSLSETESECDWCREPAYMLQKTTPLEDFVEKALNKEMQELFNRLKKD